MLYIMSLSYPHFLFLIETKVRSDYLQRVRIICGFEGLFMMDPLGKKLGISFILEGK